MVSFNRILRSVAVAAAFVAATNCSESATSPTSANSLTPSFNRGGPGGRGHSDHFLAGVNSGKFTLDQGSYIQFPGGSVCKLGESGYGSSFWNASCETNKGPVQITWTSSTTASGRARYDFQPAMRFVPDHDVVLYIYDPIAAANPNSVILYCNDSNVCINEGLTDSSLRTYHDANTGLIWRKIKHFSGYTVSSCDPSDPNYDPNSCQQS